MAQNIFDFGQFNNMSSMQKPLPTTPKTSAPATLNFGSPISGKANFQTDIAPKVVVPGQQATSSMPNFLTQNVKPQPTPSFKIPGIEQANAQEPDVIQQYLDDENEDYDNRQQIFKMIENGEDTDFIKNSIVNTIGYTGPQPTQEQEQPGFLQKLGQSYIKPIQTLGEELVKKPVDRLLDFVQGRDTDQTNTYNKNDIWKTGGALIGAGFNAVTPGLTAGLNIAGSTETGGKILSTVPGQIGAGATLGKLAGGTKGAIVGGAIGAIPGVTDFMLNNVPGLSDYYNSLDEKGKEGMQSTISGLAMMGAGGIAGKAQGKTPKETINTLNKVPENVAHGLVDAVKTMPENVKQTIQSIKTKPQNIAETVSTKANRFNALDEQKFIDTTGETPGEFAVRRGMTDVGEKAVEKASQNYIDSMKQADKAFEQIRGNFKYTGKGNDVIDLTLKDLQKRFENTENDSLPRIQELKQKYESEGLTMPEINEIKREYAKNFKYSYEERNSEGLARSTNIQNKLREWQFDKANEFGLKNIKDINKNTQAWKMFADSLEKKLNRSGANNAVSITDWITLSGGTPANLALFLGKKFGGSEYFKGKVIKSLGKQTKESIISPNIEKQNIKGLLNKGQTITPPPTLKSNIKVTNAKVPQAIIPESRRLPEGKKQAIITPGTIEKGIIQESKIPLKKTKYGTNNNISNNMNNTLTDSKLKIKKSR